MDRGKLPARPLLNASRSSWSGPAKVCAHTHGAPSGGGASAPGRSSGAPTGAGACSMSRVQLSSAMRLPKTTDNELPAALGMCTNTRGAASVAVASAGRRAPASASAAATRHAARCAAIAAGGLLPLPAGRLRRCVGTRALGTRTQLRCARCRSARRGWSGTASPGALTDCKRRLQITVAPLLPLIACASRGAVSCDLGRSEPPAGGDDKGRDAFERLFSELHRCASRRQTLGGRSCRGARLAQSALLLGAVAQGRRCS